MKNINPNPFTTRPEIEGIIAPMLGNLQQGMAQSPMFSSAGM